MSLSKSEMGFGEVLHRTGRLMRNHLVDHLAQKGYNYPVEFWPTLKFIKRCEYPPTQHEIAYFLLRDKATVTRLLKQLQEANLIERCTDQENRRQKRVTLTPLGEQAFLEASTCAKNLLQQAIGDISSQELESCQQILKQVFSNLTENQRA